MNPRDVLARAAMQGILSSHSPADWVANLSADSRAVIFAELAKACYLIADAMMTEGQIP